MKPYYQDDSVTIYNGDCREIVPQLGRFDLLLTDPPYGLGDIMQGGGWAFKKFDEFRQWDKQPEQSFINELIKIPSIVWGGHYFSMPPCRCLLVWDKQNPVPTMSDVEVAWTNFDKPSARISLPCGRRLLGHPTEKPLQLFSWCITQAPKETKTILDPFAGSGTTGRAAKDFGMKCTMIEIEEKYCEIAAKRMSQEVLHL